MRGPERASPFCLKAVVRAVMMFAGFVGAEAAVSSVAIFMICPPRCLSIKACWKRENLLLLNQH